MKLGARDYLIKDSSFLEVVPRVVNSVIEHLDSERKLVEAEEALRESEERFRLMAETSLDCILQTNQHGMLLYASPAIKNMLGYEPKEVEGKHFSFAISPSHSSRVQESFKKATKGEVVRNVEVDLLKRSGDTVSVEINMVPVTTRQEVNLFSIARDVTERKQMIAEHERMAKLESMGTLAGGLAHDFNNLLTVIMGNITLSMACLGPESAAFERLEEAGKASSRAKELSQQLLTFAKGGAPIKKRVSISDLLMESTKFALRGSNVKSSFSIPDDLWVAEADEGQISQAINNIAINAVQAMPNGGIVKVWARNLVIDDKSVLSLTCGKYIEIAIEDHGTGISKEHISRIFDPYFTTKNKSSGLGLATAHSIINKHGGHIAVDSEIGVGTIVHVYLPASKNQTSNSRSKQATTRIPIGEGKILVMDDEEMIRDMLGQMLGFLGYEVEVTSHGEEAIEKYAEAKEAGKPFDAVILDLTIPGNMGGKEAIKKLLEIDPGVKAIVSSGYSDDPIMANCSGYGFSAVAAKPYDVVEMGKTLHRIMAQN
jgi:two-component system cell cycle sensor histidine kinase/response regulator CckA